MINIDLCKLRPGDVILSRAPAWSSRAIALFTGSRYSHAMIVLYPDIWFETDGVGAGFKIIDNVKCYQDENNKCTINAQLNSTTLKILRPKQQATPSRIVGAIESHITLKYPGKLEFLPLFWPLQFFPKFTNSILSFFIKKDNNIGGYCSQIVSKILRNVYGISVGGPYDHISPGMLGRRLLTTRVADTVNCFIDDVPPELIESPLLQKNYALLLGVANKLRDYQYPHDRKSFEAALSKTFKESGINDDPKKFSIDINSLRKILTNKNHFRLHEVMWENKYK